LKFYYSNKRFNPKKMNCASKVVYLRKGEDDDEGYASVSSDELNKSLNSSDSDSDHEENFGMIMNNLSLNRNRDRSRSNSPRSNLSKDNDIY
jgi:hypothetical protein